ncbi:hypothetical protein BGZ99_009916 [Dissophora globulifera]|uniref:tRNA-binding domain-containing protein n=1 Tax=Dissophora globulifera TaxID=979702 RepID=A0A9P6RT02_9FUNG|nr:hypothetical protein BGZ99_009916 [Dissophora globulifera]
MAAYSLARFSTFSAAASSSPISPAPASKQDRDSDASRNHEDRAHSNPALEDNQSEPASSSTTSSSAVTSSTAAKNRGDEKEDDWAVNECYSGHSNHDFSPSSSSSSSSFPSTSTSDSSPDMSSLSPTSPLIPITSDDTFIDNDANSGYESRALGPSPSSFKSASAIQASWRRTSESLPSVVVPEGTPALASKPPNTAGGLDLSSSTLVQQMLFQERAPHVDSSEQANQVDEGVDRSAEVLPATEPVATTSPTLTSMMLNQSMVDSSPPGELVALPPIVPNHTTSKKIEQDGEEFIDKLDIRVGIVRSVARHPDAESLYIEQVDVGDKEGDVHKESRTIVSGLVRHVPQEYLEGRAVIVVGNMKPSKLRGVISEGMLLCAMEQDLNGVVTKVGLLEPAEGSQAGDKVTFEGYTDEGTIPAPVLTPKRKWFEKTQVHFSVKDGVAYYKGSPFRTVKGLVRCRSIVEGQIS